MNFLAHLYLSGSSDHIRIGNFIGDFVKGSKYTDYLTEVQQGILLHREIDSYTDEHDINKAARRELSAHFRHYSGVVLDLYWDHFLASHWSQFHEDDLESYTLESFDILNRNWDMLPSGVKRMLPYMEKDNWLLAYSSVEGISNALKGLSRRTQYDSNMDKGGKVLTENYDLLEEQFFAFMPDLQQHVSGMNPYFRYIT